MQENLDQQRARFAWEKVKGQDKEYVNLSKGLPALIMQSGLMPVLAFLHEKGKTHHQALLKHLCTWLQQRFPQQILNEDFTKVMTALMGKPEGNPTVQARFYQMATEEALSILRWIRQFSAAVSGGN